MLTKLLLPPGRLTIVLPLPMRVAATDDGTIAAARMIPRANPGPLANARPIAGETRSLAAARAFTDAGPLADARSVADSGTIAGDAGPFTNARPLAAGCWTRRGAIGDTGLRDRRTAHVSKTGPVLRRERLGRPLRNGWAIACGRAGRRRPVMPIAGRGAGVGAGRALGRPTSENDGRDGAAGRRSRSLRTGDVRLPVAMRWGPSRAAGQSVRRRHPRHRHVRPAAARPSAE